MRLLSLLLVTLAAPALAEPVTRIGIAQNGTPIALEFNGTAYVAQVTPYRFTLTFPSPMPEVVAITFGREGLHDMLDLPPESGLFGPGTAYARNSGPRATFYMTDPLCASVHYGPGFNLLDTTRATAQGFPVTRLEVDSASNYCDVAERLPVDTDLLGQVSPLYAVVRTDEGQDLLIFEFVGS